MNTKPDHGRTAPSHPHLPDDHAAELPSTPAAADSDGAAALMETLDSLSRKLDSFSGSLLELFAIPPGAAGFNSTRDATADFASTDVMDRLRNLEEQQRNLQSQFNSSR